MEQAIQDAMADVCALDLVLEVAVPDEDAASVLGLSPSRALHIVAMDRHLHHALLRSVMHVRRSVEAIHGHFHAGGAAAMMRGMDRGAA